MLDQEHDEWSVVEEKKQVAQSYQDSQASREGSGQGFAALFDQLHNCDTQGRKNLSPTRIHQLKEFVELISKVLDGSG